MTTEPPIACTLDAAALPDRMAAIATLGRDALTSVREGERDATLRFHWSPQHEQRLRELVAAESHCCAFLTFSITRAGDDLVLDVTAPAGGELALRSLVATFRAGARQVAA